MTDEIFRLAFDGCTAPVVLLTVLGRNHTWPATYTRDNGERINGATIAWDFLKEQRLP